jgi:hypothetical protein
VVEIPLHAEPHHVLEALAAERRVAAFAEIREILHEQDPEGIRIIKQDRVIQFDVDAQEVETRIAGECDVVAQRARVGRGVDAVRMIRLIERTAQVDRLVVQAKHRRHVLIGRIHGADFAHAEVARDRVELALVVL